MIIVKTKNGARFVNDKQSVMVNHNKEEKQVEVVFGECAQIINDVESVTYTTDVQPLTLKDDGSEVVKLKKEYEELEEKFGRFYDMCNKQKNIIDEYALSVSRLSPHAQREKFLKDELERLDKAVRNKYPDFDVTFGHHDVKSVK